MRIKECLQLIALTFCFLIVPLAHGKENFIKATISINGIEKELLQTIEENLFILGLTCEEAEWRVRYTAKKIDIELGESLNAFGYYNGSFIRKVEKQEKCWHLFLDIDPGPRIKIESVEVIIDGAAKDDDDFQEQLKTLPLNVGDYLRHDKYEKIKELIEAAAQTRGYFDGKYLEHTLRINKAKNLAHVSIQYDSGLRYHFGETRYEQNLLTEELFAKLYPVKAYETKLS